MGGHDEAGRNRPIGKNSDGAGDGRSERDDDDGARRSVRRSEPHVDVRPGGHDSELHPDTPETMQKDHDAAPGRQRYADSRPGDYARDFQADGSGSHPVKPLTDDAVDENGIPDIAETEPPERRKR